MMDYVIEIYKQLNPDKEVPEVTRRILKGFEVYYLKITISGNEIQKRPNCVTAPPTSK